MNSSRFEVLARVRSGSLWFERKCASLRSARLRVPARLAFPVGGRRSLVHTVRQTKRLPLFLYPRATLRPSFCSSIAARAVLCEHSQIFRLASPDCGKRKASAALLLGVSLRPSSSAILRALRNVQRLWTESLSCSVLVYSLVQRSVHKPFCAV